MFFLWSEFEQLFSVTDRSGMTFATWIVAVVLWNLDGCSREDWDRCREGIWNPETGRYSGVVVRLTGLCVKIVWMQVFPFWLRATVPYLSRWMDEHGDICKMILLWDELYGLWVMIASGICEQDACDVNRPWRVSFANLGPCWLDILYYQKAGMEFNEICSIGTLQSILREK